MWWHKDCCCQEKSSRTGVVGDRDRNGWNCPCYQLPVLIWIWSDGVLPPLLITFTLHSLLLEFSLSWDTTKSNLKIRCPSCFEMWLRPIVAEVGEPQQCCRRQISPGWLIMGWRAHCLIAYRMWSFIKSKLNFPSIDSCMMEQTSCMASIELPKANIYMQI